MIFDKKRRVAVSGRALFCVFAGWLNAVLAEAKADKNRSKCLNFVYRPNEDRDHGDKNRSKCLNLVYRPDEDSARRSENRPDSVVRTKTTLPEIIKASVHVSIRGTLYPCGGINKKQ